MRAPLTIPQRQVALLGGVAADGAPVWAVTASTGPLGILLLELWTPQQPPVPLSARVDGRFFPVHAAADPDASTLALEWDAGLARTFDVPGLDRVARVGAGDLVGGAGLVAVDELVVAPAT